jgi:hypothetical protein
MNASENRSLEIFWKINLDQTARTHDNNLDCKMLKHFPGVCPKLAWKNRTNYSQYKRCTDRDLNPSLLAYKSVALRFEACCLVINPEHEAETRRILINDARSFNVQLAKCIVMA